MPSSPVVPFDDPTLLFTNAGMNQFKDVFTGRRTVDYTRAASSQKCIRAGGKHNDLDNVGYTARHHTFFEMLGNFSFGDYFKEEAIVYAWEWVTRVLQLPVERLYATVYEDDDEAFALWEKVAPALKGGRILRFGKKDNYWSMGDVGPCGPCSEIHFDRGEKFGTGPQDVVNGETDRFVEIWNLVFMQFDQQPDGTVVPLPKPSVDTGAGLERIAAIMQGVESNFEIDIFRRLIEAIVELTGTPYDQAHRASHHVVADHLRALTFAIADGAGISNEGRGYVLRRILRRAARHGRLLGAHEPFMYRLVPVLVEEMGEAFPEIREKQEHVQKVVRAEEESFGRTLETGLEMFARVAERVKAAGGTVIPGEEVFRLYDTYGFPYDLTEIMAQEQGFTLDREGFERAMQQQQERSRAAGKFAADASEVTRVLEREAVDLPATEFVRGDLSVTTTIVKRIMAPGSESRVYVICERTPFYTEAGGQVSDTGSLRRNGAVLKVTGMRMFRGLSVHEAELVRGSVEDFREGATVVAEVDAERRWDIMRNHTATHLLHAALRTVLGEHVKQSGSYVGPDRLRFDFSHHQPMTPEELDRVERLVNEKILAAVDVQTDIKPLEEARREGAMALFGEKYEDTVRVVSVPGFSKELCGGTHVENTAQIGPFFITVETGIASGVRRIEAITGRRAIDYMLQNKRFRRDVAATVNRPEAEALAGVRQLREQVAQLQKDLKKARAAAVGGGTVAGERTVVGPLTFWRHDFGRSDRDTMAAWVDRHQAASEPVVALAVGEVNGKVTVILGASAAAVKEHAWHCGKVAGELLPQFGGRGGGKPSFAQGSVAADTKPEAVMSALEAYMKAHAGVVNG